MSYIYTNAYSQYGASMGRRDNVAEADEAKQDYMEVNFDGATYYIRG